jgi:aspartyl-tRNA(Asn)/glutamyl-tRNA(Gln) amidotransferase subunit A
MIAFASSLDQGGTITRSAEDAALMLDAMAGFDPLDSTSLDEPVPGLAASLNEPLGKLTIGVPENFFDEGLDAQNADTVQAALRELEKLGATLKPITLANIHLSVPTYYVVAPAEASSNLSRYDGVRFGHRSRAADDSDLVEFYRRNRAEGFGPEVQRRILTGTYVLSAGYYDAYYLKAQKARQLISRDFREAFAGVDLIAGPTTPTPAFAIGQKMDDPIAMYLNDIYTIGANLAGLPALSMPCGLVGGLPVGLQLIGPHLSEAALLRTAHHYQRETGWHLESPEGFA